MKICDKCNQIIRSEVEFNTLGKRLKALRLNNNTPIKDVSHFTGISISSISLIENNKRRPSIDVLLILARFYNVSLDYLMRDGVKKG